MLTKINKIQTTGPVILHLLLLLFFLGYCLSDSFQINKIKLSSSKCLLRLREYEVDVDRSTRRGPEVERIYFVILEMARKLYFSYPSCLVVEKHIFISFSMIVLKHGARSLLLNISNLILLMKNFYGCFKIFMS